MPVVVFVLLTLMTMLGQAHNFFTFYLTPELIVLFNTTRNTMAWSASSVFLVAFINIFFMSVWRTMISTKSILRIYFIVWVIGVILMDTALFLNDKGLGLWIPGFLLNTGVGILGSYSMLFTLFADYSTDHTKLPRVFALVNLMQSLVQFGCSFCEYYIYIYMMCIRGCVHKDFETFSFHALSHAYDFVTTHQTCKRSTGLSRYNGCTSSMVQSL